MSRTRSLTSSFGYAFNGFKTAFKKEPNFRIHIVVATTAIISALFLGFSFQEWLILVFTISFVIILELLNTSVESIVDLVSPEIQPKAKVAKDVSAAAVLLSTVVAVFVGLALFLPKIL